MDLSHSLDSLFTAGSFDRLEVEALRLLHSSSNATNDEQVAAHLYLGFTWELSGKHNASQEAFLQALELQPGLRLDQVYVPPSLYSAFERTRRSLITEPNILRPVTYKPNKRVFPPHYLLGTISNFIVPGSGYVVSGRQNFRGYLWMGLQAAGISMLIDTYNKTDEAERIYESETNQSKMDKRYDEYNEWNKLLMLWGGINAAIYISSQIDFQVSSMRFTPVALNSGYPDSPPVIGMKMSINF